MVVDLTKGISQDIAERLIGNRGNAEKYLVEFNSVKNIDLPFRTISRGKNAGSEVLNFPNANSVWKAVIDSWDYSVSKDIIRNIFESSKKYKNGVEADSALPILLSEWSDLKLGDVSWPFRANDFDKFVQRINVNDGYSRPQKDDQVKIAAVKYRRIKEINTSRNDFIETLIFNKNTNIIPTLKHSRGVDFFIDGVAFDQKVSKSVTEQFKRDFGENWRNEAIENPSKVAEYLYTYQDEQRFGHEPRLFVVNLDEDIEGKDIKAAINLVDLEKPIELSFTYAGNGKTYKTQCFIILLRKGVQ